eukprot:PhM_4_TR1398/c0_g1_i1/m.66912
MATLRYYVVGALTGVFLALFILLVADISAGPTTATTTRTGALQQQQEEVPKPTVVVVSPPESGSSSSSNVRSSTNETSSSPAVVVVVNTTEGALQQQILERDLVRLTDAVRRERVTSRSVTRERFAYGERYIYDTSKIGKGKDAPRVLVLMSGHMRTYRATLSSIRHKLLEPNAAPVVLATYEYEGFKVFREMNISRGDTVDQGLVADALDPYLKAAAYVGDALNPVPREYRQYPLSVPAMSQFFIMEVCADLAMRVDPDAANSYDVFLRVRPDMFVLGQVLRILPTQLEYTCSDTRKYTTSWSALGGDVLVAPHHPIYRWKELFSDHTIALHPKKAVPFFNLYTEIGSNKRKWLVHGATAERMWRRRLEQIGVRAAQVVRVPGWHVLLRNMSHFGTNKATNRNELVIFGTTNVHAVPCPAADGHLIDVPTSNVKRIFTVGQKTVAVVRTTVRVRKKRT